MDYAAVFYDVFKKFGKTPEQTADMTPYQVMVLIAGGRPDKRSHGKNIGAAAKLMARKLRIIELITYMEEKDGA